MVNILNYLTYVGGDVKKVHMLVNIMYLHKKFGFAIIDKNTIFMRVYYVIKNL